MIHNPHSYQCIRCVRLNDNCDKLDFSKMKVVGNYPGVSLIVKCSEYERREIRD